MIIFAGYDQTPAPDAGLTPAWVVLYDAATGLPIAQPTITNIGDGLYQIGAGLSAASAGLIDLGATALPRYLHLDNAIGTTVAAYDLSLAPLTGLAPSWDSFVDDVGAPAAQPSLTELGGGLYRIDYSGPASRSGVLDLGATASPRYYSWSFDPFNADPPTITNMTPTPGAIVQADSIEFDVQDIDPGLLKVGITLKYDSRTETIVVHDGTNFQPPFDGAGNTRTVISDGFHYEILPAGGWTGGFTLNVTAIDGEGNLA